jgi:tetratricopeptide (TPR) repeat protein
VYLARKELARADEQMELALRWQPPPSVVFGYHLERGRGLCERGEFATALHSLDTAQRLFPDHPLPERLRGRAYLELQRYAEAERSYSAYLRKGGEAAADVFRGRGLARMRLGRYPDAVDDYTRARPPAGWRDLPAPRLGLLLLGHPPGSAGFKQVERDLLSSTAGH